MFLSWAQPKTKDALLSLLLCMIINNNETSHPAQQTSRSSVPQEAGSCYRWGEKLRDLPQAPEGLRGRTGTWGFQVLC